MAKRFFNGENDTFDSTPPKSTKNVRQEGAADKSLRRDFTIPVFESLPENDLVPPAVHVLEASLEREPATPLVHLVGSALPETPQSTEEAYDFLEPVKYRKYIKNLKPSATHDGSSWPLEIIAAFEEIGAVEK